MTISITLWEETVAGDIETTHRLPAKWEICPRCAGDGCRDINCVGGKMLMVDLDALTDEQAEVYETYARQVRHSNAEFISDSRTRDRESGFCG